MRWSILIAALSTAPLFAQPAVTSLGATQTQAVFAIRGYSGNCTLELSEASSFAPVVPDVDSSLYGGSNIDTFRPDTITWADGTRVVTLGHQTDDRALAAATTYYLRVSGCGGTATASFTTPTLGTGSTMQWPVPFNAAKWGNLGYPTIDLINPKSYVDPITGVKLRPLNLASHWSFRTGGSWAATSPFALSGSNAFADWAGGTGWSSPASALSGGTSSASTTNSNPLDLYLQPDQPWFGYQTLDDLGIVLYGGATASAAVDRQVQVCIFLNPAQGCIGSPITVTLPQGSIQVVPSSGADPDKPWPASFPAPLFSGWGINGPIHAENRSTNGTLSASGGNLTLASVDWLQHFSDGHSAGNRIKIAGSGCSPNDMCTIASIVSANAATTSEPVTVGNASFVAYGMGVRIWKLTGTGSATVGARYKVAGSRTVGTQAGNLPCQFKPVTAGDGKKGYVCEVGSPVTGADWLYFIADDGTVRRFSILLIPNHQSQLNSMPSQDRPNSGANIPRYPVGFDATDPNTFYAAAQNSAGGLSIYKLAYTGDYTQDLDFQYTAGPGGDTPDNYAPALDHMQWSNVMAPSQGKDLQTQIAAKYPSYRASIYGDWNTGVNFAGISGSKALFYKAYSGQDGGPGWVAVVDLPSGNVSNLIHTADGTGSNNFIQWGSLHALAAEQPVANTLALTTNVLNSNDTNRLHGGPFQASITGLMRGGAWSSNTALPWPPDSSYDTSCPAANAYEFMGATGNQCVTIRIPQGGVCNIAPAAIEKSTWPCPWNPNYAQPFSLKPGAVFSDAGGGVDDEKFRILSVATESDNQMRLVVQRNAMWDYCCLPNTHQNNGTSNCAASNAQGIHGSGWNIRMYPPALNGCATGSFVYNLADNTIGEISRLFASHGDIAAGLTPGNLSYLTTGAIKPDAPASSLFSLPTTLVTLDPPAFQGLGLPVGTNMVQSYITRINNNVTADPNAIPWMIDTNALNPSFGSQRELIANSIGGRSMTKVGTNIYKIQVLGTLAYKVLPLIGWAGRFVLRDVSAPGSNLNTAPNYSVCYAYFAGECFTASSAGEVYVKVPYAYDNGGCVTGVSWANVPCVVSGLPSGGGVRQQAMYKPDKGGSLSRFLTYMFSGPGQHYPFTGVGWLTSGKTAIAPGSHIVNGWGTMGWVIQLPTWQEDSLPRNSILALKVQLPAGSQYAEVQFGYSRYGSPSQFFCSPRADGCNTSVASGGIFNYESETRTLNNCASGCTIQVPVIAPNLVYYRVRRSTDGSTWASGEIQALPVP